MRGTDDDETAEAEYQPFITNRALSYFPETLMYANDMNMNHHIDKRPQYEYLLAGVRKGKRFAKWAKAKETPIHIVMEYYGCNKRTAEKYMSLMDDADISELEKKMNKGDMISNATTRSKNKGK